ncbi:hypothetical protein BN1013_02386 [Candidatus Rubidus massiliensis]|nr:hypothetical protein BN1013_02386 [Candidatus Rubidus massiliensis]
MYSLLLEAATKCSHFIFFCSILTANLGADMAGCNNSINAKISGLQAFNPSTGGWAGRTIIGGTNVIVSNGDGIAGNPTIDINAGGLIDPLSIVEIWDDFCSSSVTGTVISGEESWTMTNNSQWNAQNSNSDANHPGTVQTAALSTSPGNAVLYMGQSLAISSFPFVVGQGAIQFTWVFKINTLSNGTNTYFFGAGIGDVTGPAASTAHSTNGIYLAYSNGLNSGNWFFECGNAGVWTTRNTAIAVTTGWHKLVVTINAAGNSVSATIDGVSVGTAITTNIPSIAITPFIGINRTAGTVPAQSLAADIFTFQKTMTNPR